MPKAPSIASAALVLSGLATLAFGQAASAPPARGIQVSDMNRSVEPCTDFYEYANGGWRAANPIPSSLPRWSRRWQAGESSKDRLKLILDEAAAAPSPEKGSTEQLIGDFYGACMDMEPPNALALGLDISASADRWETAVKARDTGLPAASAPFQIGRASCRERV